jgi:hypothetical protein
MVMFRSSVAAFYLVSRRHFYGCGSVHRGRFKPHGLQLQVLSEIEKIVYRMSEILFAAEIAFRRLDGCVAKQELNLLHFTTAVVTQLRACSPQVVRRDVLQAHPLATAPDDVPVLAGT